jgi:flap endonuclease-1
MGVQIAGILPKKEIKLEDLKNRKIAIDAFNWIYQFLSIIRDRETGEPLKDSKGRITSHLSGLFYRTSKLIEAGIKPVYVFDGLSPEFKYVSSERSNIRREAERKWREAIEKEDFENIRKFAQASSRLTNEMIEQSKNLLDFMGLPHIQALSEGEAQCAHLCKKGLVFATASQDVDSLLFGSPRLIKNLSITGKRRMPKQEEFYYIFPELIELDQIKKELGITREQLIIMGLLIGSDFNPGIKGIGPKRALELVKKEKTLEKVLKSVEWNIEVPAEVIYDFYLNPPVKEVDIQFKKIQSDKILKLLVDEHEFSQERIEKVIKTLEKSTQNSLDSWLK